jgi:hypothetical protein
MDKSDLAARSGVHLLIVRDGVVEGAGDYSTTCEPVTVIATEDRAADAARLLRALASLPHAPSMRRMQKIG